MLLEVLIALTLFVIAAAVVGAALRSTMNATADIGRAAKAANLARSVLAELSAGGLELVDTAPTPFAEDAEDEPIEEGWTYEIATEDITGTPGLKQVTIIVRHDDPVRPQACRLTQWMVDPNVDLAQFGEVLP